MIWVAVEEITKSERVIREDKVGGLETGIIVIIVDVNEEDELMWGWGLFF